MTAKQPDRWERMVDKVCYGVGLNQYMYKADVVKLLRQQHKAVVMMVKDQYNFATEMGLSKQGYKDLLIEILNERAK